MVELSCWCSAGNQHWNDSYKPSNWWFPSSGPKPGLVLARSLPIAPASYIVKRCLLLVVELRALGVKGAHPEKSLAQDILKTHRESTRRRIPRGRSGQHELHGLHPKESRGCIWGKSPCTLLGGHLTSTRPGRHIWGKSPPARVVSLFFLERRSEVTLGSPELADLRRVVTIVSS